MIGSAQRRRSKPEVLSRRRIQPEPASGKPTPSDPSTNHRAKSRVSHSTRARFEYMFKPSQNHNQNTTGKRQSSSSSMSATPADSNGELDTELESLLRERNMARFQPQPAAIEEAERACESEAMRRMIIANQRAAAIHLDPPLLPASTMQTLHLRLSKVRNAATLHAEPRLELTEAKIIPYRDLTYDDIQQPSNTSEPFQPTILPAGAAQPSNQLPPLPASWNSTTVAPSSAAPPASVPHAASQNMQHADDGGVAQMDLS